jgi:hypothetical protein
MKFRQITLVILTLGTLWHSAFGQPKKSKIQVDAPALDIILLGGGMQSDPVISDLSAFRPETPLGPSDVLKSYEIAMSLVADKTANDFAVIVQTQQANQITRERAEYLLQQRYQIAMMQYQVLSSLHDVLKHDIDEATVPSKRTLNTAGSGEVLMVPLPISPSGSR